MTNEMQTAAINPRHSFEEYTAIIPADLRWKHIRDGLGRAIELSHFSIRDAAAKRGAAFLCIHDVQDLTSGASALFGWIPPTFEESMS